MSDSRRQMSTAWRCIATVCVLLAGSIPCLGQMLGSGTNTVPFTDSFESYTNGQYLVFGPESGIDNSGWYSEAPDAVQVINDTSIANYLGQLVLTNASVTHTNVLKLDSTVSNIFEYSSTTNHTWIDMMMKPRLWDEDTPPAMSNCQAAVYFDSNGFINAWCSIYSNALAQPASWLTMTHPPIGTDDWIRLTIELVYTNFLESGEGSGGMMVYGMQLNSADPVTHYWGWTTPGPDDLDSHNGQWLLADAVYQDMTFAETGFYHKQLNSITFSGSGLIDDLVVTNAQPFFIPPHTIYASNDVGGAMTPIGSVTISEGRDAVFTIGPKIGYDGTNVNVDGTNMGWITSHTFSNVLVDHTIYCMTKPQKRWLVVTSEYASVAEGTIYVNGNEFTSGDNTNYDYNTSINVNVTGSPRSLGVGTQLACVGWSRTVSSAGGGSGTSTTFPLRGNATTDVTTVTWNWDLQFWLDTELAGSRQGTLDVGDSWMTTGQVVIITAATNLGSDFLGWSGDTNGATFIPDGLPTNMQIQVTMDSAKQIKANFSGGLTSIRGTSKSWIAQYFDPTYFDTHTYEDADNEDLDGDGLLTWQEYVAGTVPTDPKSLFTVSRVIHSNGSNRVDFLGSDSGGNVPWPFGMYRATNLLETTPWAILPASIPRSSSTDNTWWDTNVLSDTPSFYLPSATNVWTP